MEDALQRFLQSFERSPAAMLGTFESLHLPSSMQLPPSMLCHISINTALTNLYS